MLNISYDKFMNTAIVIPARLQSSRLTNKLLILLEGRHIIEYTINACIETGLPVFVFTDSEQIKNVTSKLTKTFLTDVKCLNGTERISKHLEFIPKKYKYIINVQADEPLINPQNILHALDKHNTQIDNLFYTTLHQITNNIQDIESTSTVKVVTDIQNNVLLYSRSPIPIQKSKLADEYKLFTGIYVFNRDMLQQYHKLCNTPLQLTEDVEQLKILEHGYKIQSYPTVVKNLNGINTEQDLNDTIQYLQSLSQD